MAKAAVCEEIKKKGVFARMRVWLVRQFITEVPSDIARCEFECRIAKCSPERISACENRIEYARLDAAHRNAD